MNSFNRLILSAFLIKQAGKGLGSVGSSAGKSLGKNVAKRITQAVAPKKVPILSAGEQQIKNRMAQLSPAERGVYVQTQVRKSMPRPAPQAAVVAPSAVPPSGLGLARQGFSDLKAGLGQAASSGYNAARTRLVSGLNTARDRATAGLASARGAVSDALAIPGVQGALGGIGAYGLMNMGNAGSPAAAPAMPAATAVAPAATPEAFTQQGQQQAATPQAATPEAAPDYAAMDEEGVPMTQPVEQPNSAVDFNSAFNTYMGSDYNPQSTVDQAKMQYLRALASQGKPLNAASVYNRSHGYGNW